jgi:hypothetical protein
LLMQKSARFEFENVSPPIFRGLTGVDDKTLAKLEVNFVRKLNDWELETNLDYGLAEKDNVNFDVLNKVKGTIKACTLS